MSSSRLSSLRHRFASWCQRFAGWSLRARLLAGILVLLAVVCLGIGVVSTLAVRQFLTAQLDRSLASAAMRAEGPLRRSLDTWPPPSGTPFPPGQAAGTLSCFVLADGTTIASVLTADGRVVSLTDQQRAQVAVVPVDTAPQSATVDGLGDYRRSRPCCPALFGGVRCCPALSGATFIDGWFLPQVSSNLFVFGLDGFAGDGSH